MPIGFIDLPDTIEITNFEYEVHNCITLLEKMQNLSSRNASIKKNVIWRLCNLLYPEK